MSATVIKQIQALIDRAEWALERLRHVNSTCEQQATVGSLSSRLVDVAAQFPSACAKPPSEEALRTSNDIRSKARVDQSILVKNGRVTCTFRNNIITIFHGPGPSNYENHKTKQRKDSIRTKCKRIRCLAPDRLVWWALAYPASLWTVKSFEVFDCLIAGAESEVFLPWPPEILEMLRSLGSQGPLDDCHSYQEFLTNLQCPALHDQSIAAPNMEMDLDQPTIEPVRLQRQPNIKLAYSMQAEAFPKFWELHNQSTAQPSSSIILTIPAEYQCGSVCLSVPRIEAIILGHNLNLPKIYDSTLV